MTVRWGIVATGGIARRFMAAMQMVEGGQVTAVCSRTLDRARAFAAEHGIPNAYDDLATMAGHPDIDAIYVATPHARHLRDTLTAIEAGQAVLCEKPLALSAAQSEQMIAAARAKGTFLMEAIWSRFLPSYRALAGILQDGRIGQPLLVEADFGFRRPLDPDSRLFNLELGGGALLDVGIYPIHLCQLVLGSPDRISADAVIGETGADEQVAAVLHYGTGALGVIKAAVRVNMSCRARIAGTEGSISIPPAMHYPDHFVVTTAAGSERIETPFEGDGLRFEIDEVQSCLQAGRTQSEILPLDGSLSIARTMDAIRDQIGLTYPGEAESRNAS